MSNYPLSSLAEFTQSHEGERVGLLVRCPNCGVAGGAYFADTEWRRKYPGVAWQMTGDSLSNLTLSPSFKMIGHYHSWIRNGQLCVDSPFECTKQEAALPTRRPDMSSDPINSTSCIKCGKPTTADSDPSTFSSYCPACGYRARIGGDVASSTAPVNDAEWRRQHGFPE